MFLVRCECICANLDLIKFHMDHSSGIGNMDLHWHQYLPVFWVLLFFFVSFLDNVLLTLVDVMWLYQGPLNILIENFVIKMA
jgi:hypothetical protein